MAEKANDDGGASFSKKINKIFSKTTDLRFKYSLQLRHNERDGV